MSFIDVRDLSEHLKTLGYPNVFPLSSLYSNYGGPNSFKVVANILQWLTARLEPGYYLPGGTNNENDRVLLIRSATEFMVTKTGIKINPRKLYSSTTCSAKELLKITTILKNSPKNLDNENDSDKSHIEIDFSDKIGELRLARELSSDLTNRGAILFDLLAKEMIHKETRNLQANRPMEFSTVERTLKTSITQLSNKLLSSKNYLEISKNEKLNLNNKLQRKVTELERSRQRLQALQKVRPAYLEEFERLENDLRQLFDQYMQRIRCVDALKAQLLARSRTPTPIEIPIARPTENSMTFLPEGLIDSDDDDDVDEEGNALGGNISLLSEYNDIEARNENLNKQTNDENVSIPLTSLNRGITNRLRIRTGMPQKRDSRVIGSMAGNNSEIDGLDSSLGSDDTESEMDLIGSHGIMDDLRTDDDDEDEDDDENENIAKLTRELTTTIKPSNKLNDHSDEDF